MSFTIELVGGATQSLAAWGITSATRTLRSLAPDVLRLEAAGLAADAARLFDYGSELILRRDSTIIFRGVCRQPEDQADGRREGQVYEIHGPWDYLERTPFQQLWTISDGAGGTTTAYRSRVHLFSDINGTGTTLATVLDEILDYGLSCTGVTGKFQIGTLNPATYCPPIEGLDISCAEAIRQVLRYAPDAVQWFDYSTSPPTLNIDTVANLTAVNIAPVGTADRFQILRNRQQEVSAVVIFYEIGDPSYPSLNSISKDAYPASPGTGRELGALCATVSLQGGVSSTRLTQEVDVAPLADADSDTEAVKLDWWMARVPDLAKAVENETIRKLSDDGTGFEISGVSFDKLNEDGKGVGSLNIDDEEDSETYYPNELVYGAIPPWMQVGTINRKATFARVFATLSYYVYIEGTGDKRHVVRSVPVSVRLIATDAVTKLAPDPYSKVTGGALSETPPTGLAQALYESLNRPQYAGDIELVTEEVGDVAVGVGNKLNLTGMRAEWATMDALITEVTEDYFAGSLQVRIGPTPQLGFGDLVELLQASRWRRIPDQTARATGIVGGSREIGLPSWTPATHGTRGQGASSYDRILDPETPDTNVELAGVDGSVTATYTEPTP